MANELQEFLKLLGRIVSWLFKATLNVICFCLFLLSLLALWRTYWIIKHVATISTMKDFRKVSATHFGLAILDVLLLPFALVAILIPTRTYHVIKEIIKELHASNHGELAIYYYYKGSIRLLLFYNFWIGIFGDLFCLFWGLLSLLVPTRTIAFFNACIHHFDDYKRDDYCTLRQACLYNFLFAILDIVAIIHGAIGLLIPTRTYLLLTQFTNIYNDPNITYLGPISLRYTIEYRVCAFKSFYCGVLDLCIIIIALLSCLFLVRISSLISLLRDYIDEYKQDKYGDLRIAICINCLLSILDLFCIFAVIVVCITCIRFYPLLITIQSYWRQDWKQKDIYTEYKIRYNLTWRQNICKHFLFLFVDILFVPLLLLCFLSIYQGIELYHLIRDSPQYDEKRMNLIRKKVIVNFMTLVFDIIFMTPLMIIIIFSIYRIPSLYHHMKYCWNVYYLNQEIDKHHTLNQEAVPLKQQHKAANEATSLLAQDKHHIQIPPNTRIHICMNVLVILGDIFVMVPCMVLILLTCYRIPYLLNMCKQYNHNTQQEVVSDYMQEYEAIYKTREHIFISTCYIFADIPCAILCIIVFITIWRAFKLFGLLTNDTTNASDFRKHSFFEFLYLLRDIICLIPLAFITVTLFRLPILILKIVSKLRIARSSYNKIQLKIEAASLEFQEKGKPRIWIRKATKNAHFALNNEMAKKGNLRLFVLSDSFWSNVSDIFGSAISTAGQSMLPNKLSHGMNQKSGLNYGTSNGLNFDLITDESTVISDVPFMIQQFIGKRSTILKNLNKFSNPELRFLFQMEHDEYGILFVIALSIRDLIECAQSHSGVYHLSRENMNFNLSVNDIHNIRGDTESAGIIDIFWVIVTMEFVKLLADILHLLLFLLLICVPWRCMQCVYYLMCDEILWSLYHESYVVGMIQHSYFIYVKLYDLLFEPMLNDMVKMSYLSAKPKKNRAVQYEKWCKRIEIYYNEYQDAFKIDSDIYNYEDKKENHMKYVNFVSLGLSTYDVAVKQSLKKLKHIKPEPPTKPLIMDLFHVQNMRIYLKIMQSKANSVMLNDIRMKWGKQSILMEQLHAQQSTMKQQMVDLYRAINQTYDERKQQICNKHNKRIKCGVLSKNIGLMQRMIRFFVYKAVIDLLVIIGATGIIFVLCLPFIFDHFIYEANNVITVLYTIIYYIAALCLVYYLVPFRNIFNLLRFKYHIRTSGLRFGFKQIIFNHFKIVAHDIWNALQFIIYTLLIIITFVRLFEFISDLVDGGRKHGKNKMNLRLAKYIARNQASQIWHDLYQLFNLFFMWKTYKFAITSLVFGVLLPAAGFIEIFAMICSKCARKMRQICAIMLWFGFLIAILIIITSSQIHVPSLYILCFTSLGFCFAFFVSLFVFIKLDKHDIQRQPREEYQRIDYNHYYIHRLCSICWVKCDRDTIQNTMHHRFDIHCKICSKYLYKSSSYSCSSCNTFWCINCGNVNLPVEDDDKNGLNQDTNSVSQILWSFANDEFVSSWIRLTWPNIVAFVAIMIDFLMMSSILFYIFHIQSIFSITSNPTFEYLYTNDEILRQYVQFARQILLQPAVITSSEFSAISSITLIIGGLWVILVSLPLVCEQLFGWVHKKGTFTQSTMWIKATWIYQIFFVLIIVLLIKLFQCDYLEAHNGECIIIASYSSGSQSYSIYSWSSIMAFVFITFFWFTSSICNVYNNVQICWSSTDNLDIRYPLAFTHCLQLLQSVFIVSGMLLVLTNVQVALLICCICSWLMLCWHLSYHWISKCMIHNKQDLDMIHNFTSVPYFTFFQIMVYCLLTYIVTVLYVYIYAIDIIANNDTLASAGDMIKYGCMVIIILGLLCMFIYRYILQKQRIHRLHEGRKLNEIVERLTKIYEETSKYGAVDHWYHTIGKHKVQKLIHNPWTTSTDLTYLLIEFERHILYHRLDCKFLQQRNEWIAQLLFCDSITNDDFEHFILLIDRLTDSIVYPPFFTLCMRALCEESDLFSLAPLEICFIIMDFIMASNEIRMIANDTLLDTNQFPSFNHKKNIIQRMILFDKDCDNKLDKFIQDIAFNDR